MDNVHSHWHSLYLYYVEQFSPEHYLENLKQTISQQWQNGLPVIEDLLKKKAYQDSLEVIQKTLDSMLRDKRVNQSWSPENYPAFFRVVIQPEHLNFPDNNSRRSFLKQVAPDDLLAKVMQYWKSHLQDYIPDPKMAQKSEYGEHAQWMSALQELSPASYQKILNEWQVVHKKRSNLWKAMARAGLRGI